MLATGDVLTVNDAVVAPAGTVMVAGTCATESDDANWTTSPPVGAGRLRVSFAVDDTPPTTDGGVRRSLDTPTRRTANIATTDVPSTSATNRTDLSEPTAVVVTLNFTDVAPAATVTVAGTCAVEESIEETATTWPPAGAFDTKVKVATEVAPPDTKDGSRVSDFGTGTNTTMPCVTDDEPTVAVA